MKQISTNEVIKALTECFPNDHRFVTIYNGHTGETTCVTLQDILDIFNSQEAAIERLNLDYEKLQIKYENVENELKYQKRIYETAKAEAVKECIEKCKAEWGDGEFVCAEDFDDLLEEIVGEDK